MSEERVERRLAAILAAHVAGYSRLMGADEEGTLAALKQLRRELADPKIAEHHGRIVKTTGEGLLVEFASVVDAVRCAVAVQRAMAERNIGVSADQLIELRMGINVGDIIIEDEDIFGDGVNVAARLEGLAEPGGICVSARVQEDAAGRLDIDFEDMGEQQLKNITRPVRAYRVRAGTASAAMVRPALALNPSYARGWTVSGVLRVFAGQHDLAIEHVETALRLSPRERAGQPLVVIGMAYFFKRRFDEAAAKLLLSIPDHPGFPHTAFSPRAMPI